MDAGESDAAVRRGGRGAFLVAGGWGLWDGARHE